MVVRSVEWLEKWEVGRERWESRPFYQRSRNWFTSPPLLQHLSEDISRQKTGHSIAEAEWKFAPAPYTSVSTSSHGIPVRHPPNLQHMSTCWPCSGYSCRFSIENCMVQRRCRPWICQKVNLKDERNARSVKRIFAILFRFANTSSRSVDRRFVRIQHENATNHIWCWRIDSIRNSPPNLDVRG